MRFTHLTFLLLAVLSANGQSAHELKLQPGQWTLKPRYYYYAGVVDERDKKENPGVVLANDKPVPVKFRQSLESDLLSYINSCVAKDTGLVPLMIGVKKFELKETGNTLNHAANFDFSFVFYRVINNKKYTLYETQGNPVLTMKGIYEDPHEKNVSETLKSLLTKFNDYINTNPGLPPLALKTKLIFEDRDYGEDTILWNSHSKLKWSDFKGTNPTGPFMAQSSCVFDYRVEPLMDESVLELHIILNACFEKTNSWVKKGSEVDALLKHEQLHFDICEANILKIRNKMQQAVLNPMEFDSILRTIFEAGWEEYQQQTIAYDKETEHGIKEKEQKDWETNVKKTIKVED